MAVYNGAVGFGADWVFPSNYEVYIVNNLNDSGTGSFREGVESTISSDARIIVFNGLSGIITLDSAILFNQAKPLYIAGQTSENGILLRGDTNYFEDLMTIQSNTNGFIMRGMTFAVGGHATTCCGDNFNISGGTNIVIDRNTFVWSVDESQGTTNATNVTFSNNVLAESLNDSFHTEGTHSKGQLLSSNTNKWSIYRNAYVHNVDRNPLWGGNSPDPPLDEVEYVQNVILGWRSFGFVGENTAPLNPSVINNVAIHEGSTSRYAFAFNAELTTTNVYGRDNYDSAYRTSSSQPDIEAIGCTRCGTYMSDEIPAARFNNTTPFGYPLDNTVELSRAEVISTVANNAGDFNDAGGITSRITGYVAAESGGSIIDNQSDVGGYPTIAAGTIITDTNNNGIPDSEEGTWGNDTFAYVNNIISGTEIPTPNVVLDVLKAFPTAIGGGAVATGGRGLARGFLNSLDVDAAVTYNAGGDYYEGGLKELLVNPNVGYIIPTVSGYINIGVGGTENWTGVTTNDQGLQNVENKSFLGQLGPEGGITLTDGAFRIGAYNGSTGNLVFRHLRSRPRLARGGEDPATAFATDFGEVYGGAGGFGDDARTWAFEFKGGDNIYLDHVSGSFTYDKTYGGNVREQHAQQGGSLSDHTYAYGLYGDGSTGGYVEINPDRPNDPEGLVNNISMIKNVQHSMNRAPNMGFDGYGEVVNCIIYNTPDKNSRVYHNISLNHLANVYRRSNGVYSWIGNLESGKTPQVYTRENIYSGTININGYNSGSINLTGDPSEDNSILWIDNPDRDRIAESVNLASTEFTNTITHKYTRVTADEAYEELITNRNVGAYKFVDDSGNRVEYHDSYDNGLLDNIRDNQPYTIKVAANYVLPTLPSNTRSVGYDSTIRGIANSFVTTHGISTWDQVITNWDFGTYTVTNTAGYNALEMYAAWVAGDLDELAKTESDPSTGGTIPSNPVESDISIIYLINQ